MRENVIQKKSYDFAVGIVKLVRKFPRSTEGYVIGKQLLKSGTSIGANVEEAIGAYSKRDFSHKMSIALKETRESNYWLRIISDCELVGKADINNLLNKSEEVLKILVSIVKTTQKQ